MDCWLVFQILGEGTVSIDMWKERPVAINSHECVSWSNGSNDSAVAKSILCSFITPKLTVASVEVNSSAFLSMQLLLVDSLKH